jgi:hypothetical protein
MSVLPACQSLDHRGYRVTVESPPSPPPVVVHEHHGPPPHAPAHGYRHKHHHHGHDYELVYDSGVGCYAVVGYRDYYYSDGFFFRIGSDGWMISASIGDDARWDYCPDGRVPGGLKHKHAGKGHGHGNGKDKGNGHGKGKGKQKFSSAVQWGKYGT